MRNSKGEFAKPNTDWIPLLGVTLLTTIGIQTFNLSLKSMNQEVEIEHLRAYSKHIEGMGLTHFNNSIKEPNLKVAKVTAYSCGGIKNEAEMEMNCPSLKGGQPKTASGTPPIPYKTMACDKSLLGKEFDIKGVGTVRCTDTGGAIKGENRFDLYVYNIDEALDWGTKYVIYEEK